MIAKFYIPQLSTHVSCCDGDVLASDLVKQKLFQKISSRQGNR